MTFPDRLRLPLDFDPGLLARDLDFAVQGGWTGHFVRQNYQGDWQAIALRAPSDARHPSSRINARPVSGAAFVDTPLLGACPSLRAALSRFGCALRSVRLMRLAPGSVIKEHFDQDYSFEEGMTRLHVPVITNPDVDFRLNGTRVEMAAGSTWYLRLSDPHSVANRGATDRVHLVIDAEPNDWLAALFDAAADGKKLAPAWL